MADLRHRLRNGQAYQGAAAQEGFEANAPKGIRQTQGSYRRAAFKCLPGNRRRALRDRENHRPVGHAEVKGRLFLPRARHEPLAEDRKHGSMRRDARFRHRRRVLQPLVGKHQLHGGQPLGVLVILSPQGLDDQALELLDGGVGEGGHMGDFAT